jgi:hypothetical protein
MLGIINENVHDITNNKAVQQSEIHHVDDITGGEAPPSALCGQHILAQRFKSVTFLICLLHRLD